MGGTEEGAGASTSRLVKLHPLCIVGVSDHFTRVKVGGTPQPADSPVMGLLFGKQEGLEVSIFDAIELAYNPAESGHPTIDDDFLLKQCELFTAVYKDRELLGWYTVSKDASAEHLAFHKEFLKFNESPLCLFMDPAPSANSKDLPVKILESEIRIVSEVPTMLFVPLNYQLETLQAERISMEQVARTSPSGGSSVDAHIDGIDSSLATLSERVKLIARYLEQSTSNGADIDFNLLRQIGSLCDQIPTSGTPKLEADFMRDYNDSLALSYLANLTKNANSINELSEKFLLVHTRGSKGLV